jgi:hypothetical protein
VSCSASVISLIGPIHGFAGWPSIRLAPSAAPSWMTTIWIRTPCARSRWDSARMPWASGRNFKPAVLPAATSSGVSCTVAPITPTRTPLTRITFDGST